ncbi:hypothetical protein ACFVWR_01195 [Leifsonia sp. NPDC058292]|uniref:hypothetical protein n=1 Tax=Leifsonia sp. NPDC058292 TaxID=3346428 RepID=UPI0036D7F53A
MRTPAHKIAAGLFALGAVLAVVSAILFAIPRHESSFGWYAYAPLSSTTFAPPEADTRQGFALGTATAALLLIAGSAGWWLGRRSRS